MQRTEQKIIKRGRRYFAAIGLVASLLAVVLGELVFFLVQAPKHLQNAQVSPLLFSILRIAPKLVEKKVQPPPQPVQTTVNSRTECYLVDNSGAFGKMDVQSGKFTKLGEVEGVFGDIAYDSNKNLYAVSQNIQDEFGTYQGIFRINTENYSIELISKIRGINVAGLVFSPDGKLLGGAQDAMFSRGLLVEIDPQKGEWREILDFSPYTTSGDLAFDKLGRLFISVLPRRGNRFDGRDDNDLLLELKPNEGTFRFVGDLGYPGVKGLARGGDDVLYGFSFFSQAVFRVDGDNGATEFVSNFTGEPLGRGGGSSFATEATLLNSPTALSDPIITKTYEDPPRNPIPVLLTALFWGGVFGIPVVFLLNQEQRRFLEGKRLPTKADLLAMLKGTGFVALAVLAGQILYAFAPISPSNPVSIALHLAGCILMGLIIGLLIPKTIQKVERRAACIALPIAAVVASIVLQLSFLPEMGMLGRLVAAALLGGTLGAMIEVQKTIEVVIEEPPKKRRIDDNRVLIVRSHGAASGKIEGRGRG